MSQFGIRRPRASLTAPTVAIVKAQSKRYLSKHAPKVTINTITPEQFGLTRAPVEALAGGDAATNATILRDIFSGRLGPGRDVVLLNAAAVLVTAGLAPDIAAGIRLAAQTIDRGKVTELVADLARTT